MNLALLKLFVKDINDKSPENKRKCGSAAGIVGIISNVILFLAKLTIGDPDCCGGKRQQAGWCHARQCICLQTPKPAFPIQNIIQPGILAETKRPKGKPCEVCQFLRRLFGNRRRADLLGAEDARI